MQFLTRIHQLRAPWMAWWLALALVVAPALGRMHEVLHAPTLPQAHTAAPAHGHSHDALSVADLFGSHTALECLAFDQLGNAWTLVAPDIAACHALPQSHPVWSTAHTTLPMALAPFDARGPPTAAAFIFLI